MKNIASSFALAILLIAATVVLNYLFPANSVESFDLDDNNIEVADEYLNDVEFDKDGNMICETTYQWNGNEGGKGNIVTRTVVYEHNK